MIEGRKERGSVRERKKHKIGREEGVEVERDEGGKEVR